MDSKTGTASDTHIAKKICIVLKAGGNYNSIKKGVKQKTEKLI